MSRPAFIVEGLQEQKILQQLCERCKIIKISSNGERTIKGLTFELHGLIKACKNFHPVIVLIDRENDNRSKSVQDFIDKVCNDLDAIEENISKGIIFGIPDLTFESWILPFVNEQGVFITKPLGEFEGKRCEKKLEERLRLTGSKYNKTGSGVEIFVNKVNPIELCKVSPSFKSFYEQIKPHCKWYHRKFSSLS